MVMGNFISNGIYTVKLNGRIKSVNFISDDGISKDMLNLKGKPN
jgi:hypothetical protein